MDNSTWATAPLTTSHTPEKIFSSSMFNNSIDLYQHAKEIGLSATSHQEIVYTNVPRDWAKTALDKLDELEEGPRTSKNYNCSTNTVWIRIMPTEIHNCHQKWIKDEMGYWLLNGQLTFPEFTHLDVRTGTTIEFVEGPYAHSRKEPDLFVRTDHRYLPTLTIESGWAESFPRLHDDMNLWLVGGNSNVKVCIIIRWKGNANTNQVSGDLEVYGLDRHGIPVLRQSETIFPEPAPAEARAQCITLTRDLLFGSTIFPGRNPNDEFHYLIHDLTYWDLLPLRRWP